MYMCIYKSWWENCNAACGKTINDELSAGSFNFTVIRTTHGDA